MDAKILVAVTVLAAAVLLFSFGETFIAPEQLETTLEISKTELKAGETIEVVVEAKNAPLKKIEFTVGTEKRSIDCANKKECSLNASLAPGAGVYSAKAVVETSSGERREETARIVVSLEKAECVNSVPFGSCAREKPLYCDNGILTENCGVCGCSPGFYCEGSSCAARAGKLGLAQLNYPEKVLKGAPFRVSLIMRAEEEIKAGAKYLVEISIGKAGSSEVFTAGGLAKTDSTKFEVAGLTLESTPNDLNVAVYALNEERELLANVFTENAVSVVSEIREPAAPKITQAFAEGDDLVLHWTKVQEATGYRLYRSIDANPAFISYSLFRSFPAEQDSAVVQALEPGTHFFVMTAYSEFGGESAYSGVESVTIKE